MLDMTRISTIIPAHNAEAFIRETLDSALAQTHPDQEIIVVDDGSTDRTVEIAQTYGDRLQVIRQQNAGPAAARNAGARLASGEWLAFLDADDIWVPEKLERQIGACNGCDIAYSDRLHFGPAAARVCRRQSDVAALPAGDIFEHLVLGNCVTLSSLLIRKRLFEDLGGFDEDPDLRAVEDWEFLIRCAAAGHHFSLCPDALVHYRLHPQSISRDHECVRSRRLAVVMRAFNLPRGKLLSLRIRRMAMATAWRTSAWYVADTNRIKAALWYARSLRFDPLSLRTYKQIVKACLGRD